MSERSAPPTKVLHRGRRRGEYDQEIQSAGGGATISDLLPTRDEKDALAGTSGHPAKANKYVTHADSRLSDQRDAKSLQGRTLSAAAPAFNDVVMWNGAQWGPAAGGGGGGGGAISPQTLRAASTASTGVLGVAHMDLPGATITLPAAGLWVVMFRGTGKALSAGFANNAANLRLQKNGVDVDARGGRWQFGASTNDNNVGVGGLWLVSAAVGDVLKIQAFCDIAGGTYELGDGELEAVLVGSAGAGLQGEAQLAATYSIAADATWEDTGLSISLPTAGTYILYANVRGRALANATGGFIQAKLYNATDAVDVPNSIRILTITQVAGVEILGTWPIVAPITVTGAKTIKLYARRGAGVVWTAAQIVTDANGSCVLGYFSFGVPPAWKTRNLMIENDAGTPASKVKVTADEITVEDVLVASVSVTADITVVGANGLDAGVEAASTWYAVWLIYNPGTGVVASLLSASFTAPTLPAGYTKKRRVGAVRNNSLSNFWYVQQLGDVIRYLEHGETDQIFVNGVAGNIAFQTVSAAAVMPPTARHLEVLLLLLPTAAPIGFYTRPTGHATAVGQRVLDYNLTNRFGLEVSIRTNNAQSFDWREDTASGAASVFLTARGYRDPVL